MSDFYERMWPAFKAEAQEQLEQLDMALVRLEQSADSEDLRTVFRQFHTLKSSAAMMGYAGMEALAHAAEDVLGEIREQALDMNGDILSMLLEATDFIRGSIANLEANQQESQPTDLAQRLRSILGTTTAEPEQTEHADTPDDALLTLCDTIAHALEQASNDYTASCWQSLESDLQQLGFQAASRLLAELRNQPDGQRETQAAFRLQLAMILELAGRDLQQLLENDPQRMALVDAFAEDVDTLIAAMPDPAGASSDWSPFREQIEHTTQQARLLGFRGAQLLLRHMANLARHASLSSNTQPQWHDDLLVFTQLLADIAAEGHESAALRSYCNNLVIASAPLGKDTPPADGRDGLLAGEIEVDTEGFADHGEDLISRLTALVQVTDSTTNFHGQAHGGTEKTTIRFRFVYDGERDELRRALTRPGFTPDIIWLDEQPSSVPDQTRNANSHSTPASDTPAQAETIRIRSQSVDAVAGQVGGLLMQRNRLQHLLAEYEGSLDALSSAQRAQSIPPALATPVAQLLDFASQIRDVDDRIGAQMGTLQEQALALRVVPISTLFNRFHRSVRQIARDHDKDIALHVSGEDIRIDRGLVDRLVEPLLHLLRNSIDHGIENGAQRRDAGKDPTGTITLSAQQRGSQVLVRLTDDGAGIDPALVRHKVLARGLRSADQLAALSDADVLQLVFIPGFSTRDEVTELSGRGVGMDAVRHVVESVGGNIKLSSRPGQGCTIDLFLPLSAAIQNVVMLQSNQSPFAVADRHVREIIDMRHLPLQTVGHQHYVVIRQRTLPVFFLERLLGLNNVDLPVSRRQLLLLENEGQIMGLLCPSVTGRQQLFIQDADRLVASLPFVSGTALLGDGRVAIILDCETLFGVSLEGVKFLQQQQVTA